MAGETVIVAGMLFVLPSLFVLLALSVIYFKFGTLPWIAEMFDSLKPASVNPSTT